MPLDIAPTRRVAASARPTVEQPRALRGAAVRPREPLVHAEQLVGAQPVGEAEQLGQVAERAVGPSEPAGAPPSLAAPLVGRTSPHAILTSVDLPAPLGPSSPTSSPSPTSRLTPLRASIDP